MSIWLSDEQFDAAVADALDGLPETLGRALSNVVVLVTKENPEDPTILGLYEGIALTERDSTYAGALPDTIHIYRRPLCRWCTSEAQLRHEIAVTVVHEIAHHFGIDDARLHELGWG